MQKDTFTTGEGIDTIFSYGGDDIVTVDGKGNKTISGGSGYDELRINNINGVLPRFQYFF